MFLGVLYAIFEILNVLFYHTKIRLSSKKQNFQVLLNFQLSNESTKDIVFVHAHIII